MHLPDIGAELLFSNIKAPLSKHHHLLSHLSVEETDQDVVGLPPDGHPQGVCIIAGQQGPVSETQDMSGITGNSIDVDAQAAQL